MPNIWFLFPHLTYPGTFPWGVHTPLSQDESQSEGFWEEQDSLWLGVIPLLLTPRNLSGHVYSSLQFSHSVMSYTLLPHGLQASLSITNSWNLFKLMSIESVMPSNHLTHCCPLLLLPSIFPSIRVFSNE